MCIRDRISSARRGLRTFQPFHPRADTLILLRAVLFWQEWPADESFALSSAPAQTKFSNDDDDDNSFQRRVAARKARSAAASETSNEPADTQLKSSDTVDQNKRMSRRHARDVSYYYDDGEQRLKDLLERLESRGKRQPIDRIDEPSEWRDRLRMQTPGRLLIERHQPLNLPVIFGDRMGSKLGRFEKGLSDCMYSVVVLLALA